MTIEQECNLLYSMSKSSQRFHSKHRNATTVIPLLRYVQLAITHKHVNVMVNYVTGSKIFFVRINISTKLIYHLMGLWEASFFWGIILATTIYELFAVQQMRSCVSVCLYAFVHVCMHVYMCVCVYIQSL